MKIVLDAGHGLRTAGKQTPDGEKEWSFNNTVLLAAQLKLLTIDHMQLLRVDDATGKVDIPLHIRTDRANAWKADLYISFHHNAHTGTWGDWGGVETYTMDAVGANPKSVQLAQLIQPSVVRAMDLRSRGVRKKNLHVLRETTMPAILIEGGFMDSRTDIETLRNPKRLQAQGEAIATAIIEYFGLLKKSENIKPTTERILFDKPCRLVTGTFATKEAATKAANQLKAAYGWTVYVKEE